MDDVIKMNNLEEIAEWDNRIDETDRKYAVDDLSEIAFMVDEIEAFVPGC